MMPFSHTSTTDLGEMTCLPATADRLGDLDVVFGERGTARRCYCMYWRRPDGGWSDDRDARDRFAERLASGPPPGLIGYIDGSALGWVQVGPRAEFPTIGRSRLLKPVDDLEPWTINCFVVKAGHRKQGIAHGLLAAAIAYARSRGAGVIEAYPVDGSRSSAVDLYTGTMGMFAAHGFEVIARRKESRPIVRLTP